MVQETRSSSSVLNSNKIRESYDIIFIEIEVKHPETLTLCQKILDAYPKRIGKKKDHIHEDWCSHMELLYYNFNHTQLINEQANYLLLLQRLYTKIKYKPLDHRRKPLIWAYSHSKND